MIMTSPQPSPLDLTQGRIVIVDDEPMVTASITAMLNLEADYDAIGFNSPEKALASMDGDFPPDVVISDFLMPEMDGISFLQAIRNRYPETTLILLTGYADKENAIQAINEVGIYRYIEKPWDNEALKLAIRNGIERTRLLTRLNEKITALEHAQNDLQQYSQHLEERVTEKTHDLSLTLNKLKAVVENTGDGIVTVNTRGYIQGLNPTFASWVQASHSDTEGQNLFDIVTFQDNSIQLDDLLHAEGGSQLKEATVGQMTVEVNISPLSDQDGLVLVCRDIAKRKEAERLREDFVSTLTHDLRTPLLAGIQSVEFFLDGTLGEISAQQRNILEIMRDSNRQMLSLVNVLLDVYRYEARQQKHIMENFQLADLIHRVLLEIEPLALSKNQSLKTDVVLPLAPAYGDKHALRRVLTNLVGNAIHYTPADGHITVSIRERDGYIQVLVKDDGRGIPPADLAKLFQRFAQGTSLHRTTGTGLGLYLSRQIIEAHGGRISAESEVGKGSTFMFEVPKAANP